MTPDINAVRSAWKVFSAQYPEIEEIDPNHPEDFELVGWVPEDPKVCEPHGVPESECKDCFPDSPTAVSDAETLELLDELRFIPESEPELRDPVLSLSGSRGDEPRGSRNYSSDDPYAPGHEGYPEWDMLRDRGALETAIKHGHFRTDDRGRWHWKRYKPNRTLDDVKRGHRYRTQGEHGDGANPSGQVALDVNFYDLRAATGGGWLIDRYTDAARDQIEYCRWCGKDLELPRDEYGYVIREFVTQRQYCAAPARCQQNHWNHVRRHRRAKGKKLAMTFRLDTITLAGIGEYGSPPTYFNRLNPRRDPDKFRPKPGCGRDVFALPLHEYVMERRGARSSAEGIRLDCEHHPFCRVDLRLPTGDDVTGETAVALMTYGNDPIPIARHNQIVAVTAARRVFYGERSIPRPDLKRNDVMRVTPLDGRTAS